MWYDLKLWVKNAWDWLVQWYSGLTKLQVINGITLLSGVALQVSTTVGVPKSIALFGGLLGAMLCAMLPSMVKATDTSLITLAGIILAACVGVNGYFTESGVEAPGWLLTLITVLSAIGKGLGRVPKI